MTRFADLKMAVLAVMILFVLVMGGQDKKRMSEVEPVLMHAPYVKATVLPG